MANGMVGGEAMSDPADAGHVDAMLRRFDAMPPSEFRDVALALRIRCAACKGTHLDHGAHGECLRLRRDVMPYSLRLSWRVDEEAVRG